MRQNANGMYLVFTDISPLKMPYIVFPRGVNGEGWRTLSAALQEVLKGFPVPVLIPQSYTGQKAEIQSNHLRYLSAGLG